ncbi:hypothetical protein ERO13_D10G191900v2 [Gossypium hirsutum]|uniref:Uncharacterized protein n=2 Tax=Gossypium TaxID=3633 RepID=A0A5D2J7E5_GOSTO|nr:hypothetical protein ERO13_D10G191900v2 [Gossypium hirsutum]TYG51112.1 hypothetical protein ES288_D10G230700v1 [Gossypium darwinii]TYH50827.1 hypothetical protein ES332_D10G232200v1 [Gossypium tomentosum]
MPSAVQRLLECSFDSDYDGVNSIQATAGEGARGPGAKA